MQYFQRYKTPQGFDDLLMESDGEALCGLHFVSKNKNFDNTNLPIFQETKKWLDMYFSGCQPDFTPKFSLKNSTKFQHDIYELLLKITFGKILTYGELAKIIAQKYGKEKMSAQTVGGAVGKNPICIIIPCHRIIGANNKLGGFSGGILNKIALLKLEGINLSKNF